VKPTFMFVLCAVTFSLGCIAGTVYGIQLASTHIAASCLNKEEPKTTINGHTFFCADYDTTFAAFINLYRAAHANKGTGA
jgi:hypothetical protein